MTISQTLRGVALGVMLASAGGLAHAAEPVHIQLGDLDLATRAGAVALQTRIEVAAHHFCTDTGSLGLSPAHACHEAVREEVLDQLSVRRRAALVAAASRTPATSSLRVAALAPN